MSAPVLGNKVLFGDHETGLVEKELLKAFIREARRFPLLSEAQEIEIARRVELGESDAVSRLVEANLRFVLKTAFRQWHPGRPLMDMVSEGCIGLMRAARRYRPLGFARFATYAEPAIRGRILRFLALENRYSRNLVSVDAPVTDMGSIGEDGLALLDTLASDDVSAEETAFCHQLLELKRLTPRARKVLEMVYFQGLELAQVGAILGISAERVRQIKQKALIRLRAADRRRGTQPPQGYSVSNSNWDKCDTRAGEPEASGNEGVNG